MYSIEDLRNGKVAVLNDGTLEELIKVLKEAFPMDRSPGGTFHYYFSLSDESCGYDDETGLPIQSVKDFLPPKNGEVVEASNNEALWEKVVYVGKHPSNNSHVVIQESGRIWTFKYVRPIKVVELTMQEIADKFGVSVDKLKIKK